MLMEFYVGIDTADDYAYTSTNLAHRAAPRRSDVRV